VRSEVREASKDWETLRSDYDAGKPSRLTRQRSGLPVMGAGADYHLRNQSLYLRMIETSRDMKRNDPVVSRCLDVSTTNIVQSGFTLDPQTGNKTLDNKIAAKWKEWSEDKEQCDAAATLTFNEQEKHACGQSSCDGDIIFSGTEDGSLQAFEADQCRTPNFSKQKARIALGVQLSDSRKRLGYYLVPRAIDPMTPIKVSDALYAPARMTMLGRDFLQVFHVYDPDRVSQTRGVTLLAPVMNPAGMFDDLQLATLVQAQMVAASFVKRQKKDASKTGPELPGGNAPGGVGAAQLDPITGQYLEAIQPGMTRVVPEGWEDEIVQPNVPAMQYFPYAKLLISLIGGALGVTYMMVMLDGSDSNFSAWRGEFEEAKKRFRVRQQNLIVKFHCPVYRWKLALWIDSGEIVVPKSVVDPFSHVWTPPSWPYIEPLKDRQARRVAEKFGQISPRRAAAETGADRWKLTDELIEDNLYVLEKALDAEASLAKKYPNSKNPPTWRDVLDPWEPAKGPVAGTVQSEANDPMQAQPDQTPAKAPAKKGAAA
jgi:lambda family phage portal protein